jgi:GTP pyrophosphokinase
MYSIYKKMKFKDLPVDMIYDITAFRIIVNNIDECYKVL